MATMLRSFTVRTKDGRTAMIREARPSDADKYLASFKAVIEEPMRTMMVVDASEMWDTAGFERNLIPWGADGVRLVVVLEDDIVGGFSIHRGSLRANRHVAQFGIFLRADARGLGLGRALLEVAELWATEHEITRIEMPVFAHNERAQRLYRSMGYEQEGYERHAVRFPEGFLDEIRMAKLL